MSEQVINIYQVIKNRSKVFTSDGRSLALYPSCVQAIVDNIASSSFRYRLFVYDFCSDDYPLLEWLPDLVKDKLELQIISSTSAFFDKSEGLNYSRNLFSSNDFIFYLDADIVVTKAVIDRLEARHQAKHDVGIFAPTFLNEYGAGQKSVESTGTLWIRYPSLRKVPPWPTMRCWGGEDTVFLYHCLHQQLSVCRETDVLLYHQWHPHELRNKYYVGGFPPSNAYADAIREYYKSGILPTIAEDNL